MELDSFEIAILTETYLTKGLLRIFLNSNDIKVANKLVKNEYLENMMQNTEQLCFSLHEKVNYI